LGEGQAPQGQGEGPWSNQDQLSPRVRVGVRARRQSLNLIKARLPWLLVLATLWLGLRGVADAAGPGQDVPAPEVTATLDRTRVTVGDPIALTVVVKHAAGVTIDTTSIDDQLGSLEPLGSDPPEDKSSGAGMELRLRYKVAVYHAGNAELPVLVFSYTSPDGSQQQARSKAPIAIAIQSVLPAGADPQDIRGLKPQAALSGPPSASPALLLGAGVAAVVVMLSGMIAMLLLRRRHSVPVPAPAYAATARAELDRIMALRLLENGDLVEHYRLIAACIRRYLADRFGFPALALTSGELNAQMERHGIERWPARIISGLLSECDAVTYARYHPAAPRAEADNAMAFQIIDETDPASHEQVPQAV